MSKKNTSYSELSSSADEVKSKKQKVELPLIMLPSPAEFQKLSPEQEPLLTSKKQSFLKNRSSKEKVLTDSDPQLISLNQLQEWRNYYSEKYGIDTIINGETGFGQSCNVSRKAKYHGLQDPSLYYAIYSYDTWILRNKAYFSYVILQQKYYLYSDCFMSQGSIQLVDFDIKEQEKMHKINDYMRKKYRKYDEDVAPELTAPSSLPLGDLKIINNLFTQSCSQETLASLKNVGIKRYTSLIEDSLLNLTHDEAINEMLLIQKSLQNKQDKTVAYLYTNGASETGSNHIEVALIRHDRIIKPVVSSQARGKHKSDLYIVSSDFYSSDGSAKTAFYDSDIGILGPEYGEIQFDEETIGYGPIPPTAQADQESCGALALKYIKNLLSRDQEQLKEFSLQIPYYDKIGNKRFFFYPSPDVLYYSQSGAYNKAMTDLLFGDSSTASIKCRVDTKDGPKHKEFPFKTIKHFLEEAIEAAQNHNDQKAFQYNYNLYCELLEFCEKWYTRYQTISSKRDQMVENESGHNLALLYAKSRYLNSPQIKENKQSKDIDLKSISIEYAFQYALETADLEGIKKIIGANPEITNNPLPNGLSPLQTILLDNKTVSKKNQIEIMIFLLKNGAGTIKNSMQNVEITVENIQLKEALHHKFWLSINSGDQDRTILLLNYFPDLIKIWDEGVNYKSNVLMMAAIYNRKEVVQYLINKKIDLFELNKEGKTAEDIVREKIAIEKEKPGRKEIHKILKDATFRQALALEEKGLTPIVKKYLQPMINVLGMNIEDFFEKKDRYKILEEKFDLRKEQIRDKLDHYKKEIEKIKETDSKSEGEATLLLKKLGEFKRKSEKITLDSMDVLTSCNSLMQLDNQFQQVTGEIEKFFESKKEKFLLKKQQIRAKLDHYTDQFRVLKATIESKEFQASDLFMVLQKYESRFNTINGFDDLLLLDKELQLFFEKSCDLIVKFIKLTAQDLLVDINERIIKYDQCLNQRLDLTKNQKTKDKLAAANTLRDNLKFLESTIYRKPKEIKSSLDSKNLHDARSRFIAIAKSTTFFGKNFSKKDQEFIQKMDAKIGAIRKEVEVLNKLPLMLTT